MDNKLSESTAIKLYKESDIVVPIYNKNQKYHLMKILELSEVTYDELISEANKQSLLEHSYDSQDRPLMFLTWYNEYLFYYGTITYDGDSEDGMSNYILNAFFYTRMKNYKDVILQTIFDEKCKICITKTTRPLLTQIIDYIKTLEQKTHD